MCYVWALTPFASGPRLVLMPYRAVDWVQYLKHGYVALKLKELR